MSMSRWRGRGGERREGGHSTLVIVVMVLEAVPGDGSRASKL